MTDELTDDLPPLCSFIHPTGRQCPMNALREERFCYYHSRDAQRSRNLSRRRAQINRGGRGRDDSANTFDSLSLPPLDEPDAIAVWLTSLGRAIVLGAIDRRDQGTLAYVLQTAMSNCKNVSTIDTEDDEDVYVQQDPEPIKPFPERVPDADYKMICSPVPNAALGHFATSWSEELPVTPEEIEQVLAELEKLPLTRAMKNCIIPYVKSTNPKTRAGGIEMVSDYALMHHEGRLIIDLDNPSYILNDEEKAERDRRKHARSESEANSSKDIAANDEVA